MIFNSIEFAFFFLVVSVLFFALPHKWRWLLLLIGSCYFYMAFVPVYILIMAFTIVVDYFAGLYIEEAEGKRRKTLLVLSLVANIGVLCVFKYFNFFNANLSVLLGQFNWENPVPYLTILLPIGLSFHTFQAMSYTIEVYRRNQKAERHLGIYALYVMFYPQLVAGPIERPQNLLYQFRTKFNFEYDRVVSGLKLMGWGLFKKVVIADRLAVVVDLVFENPEGYNALSLGIGVLFFTFQIFCDFSGYSDIAIGAARVMGFKLMKNFDSPYQSTSIKEFWARWHISLSTWFKDYLYISLGGNRVSVPRWYLNLFIVFLISGFWHGANWTFIIWGALHGTYLVFELILNRKITGTGLAFKRLRRFLSWMVTFVLVMLAWVFFRADNVQIAFVILQKLTTGLPELLVEGIHGGSVFQYLGVSKKELILSCGLIVFLEVVHFVDRRLSLTVWLKGKPAAFRWGVYFALVFSIVFLGVFESRQFIYFQF